jgi:hypothetical protein
MGQNLGKWGVFVSVFLRLLEKEGEEKSRGQMLLLPLFSARPGEKENIGCRSKRHRFCFFFFFK